MKRSSTFSPVTGFLCWLEEDLFPIHFNFTIDSDGDFLHPHSPSKNITHAIWLGNPQPSFTPITQVMALSKERDCYGPTTRDYIQMDLVNFSLFILSYLTISDLKLWGDSLWELTYLMTFTISQTCVCLMVNLVLLKLNFILDSSFPCCAWLCCHTHAHHTCSMLLFHSATVMWLHHVINLRYACPKQYR